MDIYAPETKGRGDSIFEGELVECRLTFENLVEFLYHTEIRLCLSSSMTFFVLCLMCERKQFRHQKTERKILYLIFVYVF